MAYTVQRRQISESLNRVDPRNTGLGWSALVSQRVYLSRGQIRCGAKMDITASRPFPPFLLQPPATCSPAPTIFLVL